MKKHRNAKYANDPKDYDVFLQWFDRTDKHISFPVRTPKKLRESLTTLSQRSGEDGAYLFQIGNIYKFLDWIKAEKDTHTDRNSSYERGEGWSGSDSIEHAAEIAVNGEKEMNEYIMKESHRIVLETKQLEAAQYGVIRDVEGMYLDVGLYMSGEPESFYNSAEQLIPDKCLDVHIQAVYSASVSVDHVKEQIKNLVAAIASLELSGYRVAVHVWWCSETDNGHPQSFVSKCVKEHRQPINISLLVGITHPGFMRRMEFRIQELMGADSYGYGHSIEHSGHRHSKEIFYLGEELGTIDDIIKKLKEMKIEV